MRKTSFESRHRGLTPAEVGEQAARREGQGAFKVVWLRANKVLCVDYYPCYKEAEKAILNSYVRGWEKARIIKVRKEAK